MTKLTPAQRRALEILSPSMGMMAGEFARKMWPDSEGWQHSHRVGRGARNGGMMPKVGGAYLGKLARWGLVKFVVDQVFGSKVFGSHLYRITDAGRAVLKEAKRD